MISKKKCRIPLTDNEIIQKELGDGEDGADMEELEKKILAAKGSV